MKNNKSNLKYTLKILDYNTCMKDGVFLHYKVRKILLKI